MKQTRCRLVLIALCALALAGATACAKAPAKVSATDAGSVSAPESATEADSATDAGDAIAGDADAAPETHGGWIALDKGARGGGGRINPFNIDGLCATTLVFEEEDILVDELSGYFGDRDGIEDEHFMLVKLEDLDSGYLCRLVDVEAGEEYEVRFTPDGAIRRVPVAEVAEDAVSPIKPSATAFDLGAADLLRGYRPAAGRIGEDVAGRLLADVNELVSPAGLAFDDEHLLVSSRAYSEADWKERFRVMAYRGGERYVFECVYSLDGEEHSIELLP